MRHLRNPHRGSGLPAQEGLAAGTVTVDPTDARALYSRRPVADTTPLVVAPQLAERLAVGGLWLKDKQRRLGLGSFKALGASHAIAGMAADRVDGPDTPADEHTMANALAGTTRSSVPVPATMVCPWRLAPGCWPSSPRDEGGA